MISIIIPVYNREKHIKYCLDSILNNTFNDYEIIIVDDGSTDNTAKICNEYVKKDKRIKLYNIENHGVSYARNYGIELAKGEYIAFIDSDDYIDDNYLSSLYDYASKYDLDWVVCGWARDNKNHEVLSYLNHFNEDFYINDETASNFAIRSVFMTSSVKDEMFISITSACMSIFKTKVLIDNNIRFDASISFGEDMCFNYVRAHYIKSFGNITGTYYHVVSHVGKSSRIDYGKTDEAIKAIHRSSKLFMDLEKIRKQFNEEFFYEYQQYFTVHYSILLTNSLVFSLDVDKKKFLEELNNSFNQKHLRNMIDSLNPSYFSNRGILFRLLFFVGLKINNLLLLRMCVFVYLKIYYGLIIKEQKEKKNKERNYLE